MSRGEEDSLRVEDVFAAAKIPLKLRPVSGPKKGFSRKFRISPPGKGPPSLSVWGKRELQEVLGWTEKEREANLESKLKGISCLVLAGGLSYPSWIIERSRRKGPVLFISDLSATTLKKKANPFLSALLAEETTVPGGLLKMYGLGVLVKGDSGVGKSESALELVSRGHRFVSDDVVRIHRTKGGKLVGSAVPLSKDFMEIRGLGIINIRKIFGAKSICSRTRLDLIILLKRWEKGKAYDRLGLKFPGTQKILGVKLPMISIPVAPGRNIAMLMEVACKVFLLKEKGYHAAEDLTGKLDRELSGVKP